tara:strand:+ start:1010 stop:1159 length:150 start_codon:yes stop_codon:yes gene_type:complete
MPYLPLFGLLILMDFLTIDFSLKVRVFLLIFYWIFLEILPHFDGFFEMK